MTVISITKTCPVRRQYSSRSCKRSCMLNDVTMEASKDILDVFLYKFCPNSSLFDTGADRIARDFDLINLGQVGEFKGHYFFSYFAKRNDSNDSASSLYTLSDSEYTKHKNSYMRERRMDLNRIHQAHLLEIGSHNFKWKVSQIEKGLDSHVDVDWHSNQKILQRSKRRMSFSDPFYPNQWHLHNTFKYNMDINVTGVWDLGVTGKGVTVAVVDDGLEWNNPDIMTNYNAAGSWDLNSDDSDPMPDASKESNHHGTRCAGEIAAVPNNVCGVGVAYGSKVSGIRVLDGLMTDALEATAFNKFLQINDIYSCSWGPDDDGKTVDGPHHMAAAAMKYGIDFGRHGYGSIYVVASGNGGRQGDNCNYDGYANSIYTVTIGAVDETGHMPFYGEECASMLAVTFSSGGPFTRNIVTTDLTKSLRDDRNGCTEDHTGTSAAAPIAAGLIALMLEVQPCLTWRDVQYLIILTAQKVDIDLAQWQKNGAGLWHSHKHGFGLMKAWRMVSAAKVWKMVPWLTSFFYKQDDISLQISKNKSSPLIVSHIVTEEEIGGYDLFILENVQVTLKIIHPNRGKLNIILVCPSGTVSVIGASRPHDDSADGFDGWTFSTVRCWGETPKGTWQLIITDNDTDLEYGYGYLKSWELALYGTPMSTDQFDQRRRLINDAMDGRYLRSNVSTECPPPPVTAQPDAPMSDRTIKILLLVGGFCFFMAVYETFEYILCYGEEKKEHTKLTSLVKRAYYLTKGLLRGESNNPSERTGLLANTEEREEEEIPMETFSSNYQEQLSDSSQSNSNLCSSDDTTNLEQHRGVNSNSTVCDDTGAESHNDRKHYKKQSYKGDDSDNRQLAQTAEPFL
ncbi:hypothetical protein CHS0354_013905 [Potamilus streckersoni]|uniref:P/Homo B domain-containing protein n=1 Tax=Potamilus streckersoni TaxID=2493646 RepID=A0AAE0VKJ8_9BIVA|nr:hypothetical protein CHS0354_013905 [Potamilus streckersoni]